MADSILIIGDEPDLREGLSSYLTEAGYEVTSVDDYMAGLSSTEQGQQLLISMNRQFLTMAEITTRMGRLELGRQFTNLAEQAAKWGAFGEIGP